MSASITPEHLIALAQREGIRLDKANEALELVMLLGNALSRLPANQREHAKQLMLAAMLERTPERTEAMLYVLFPQKVCHGPRP